MTDQMATTGNQASRHNDSQPPSISPIDSASLNLPNLITLSRLLLAVVLFVLIDIQGLWITSAIIFVVAAATDALDGFVARRYGMVTTLGRILDPFVDKIIICGSFVFLLEKNVEADSGVTGWMVIIVLAREMFVTSLRAFLEQHGRDFSASWSGKIKMVLQCTAVTASLLSMSPLIKSPTFSSIRDFVLWSTVGVTAYSGFVYIYRAVIMLRPEPDERSNADEVDSVRDESANSTAP